MPTTKNLNNLVINRLESQDVYDNLLSTGRINDDELYLVEGDDDTVGDVKLNGVSVVDDDRVANLTVTPSSIGASSEGHVHDNATSSSDGFMSSSDKQKLDGVEEGANNYVLPAANSADSILGGIKLCWSYGDDTDSNLVPISRWSKEPSNRNYAYIAIGQGLSKGSTGVISVKSDIVEGINNLQTEMANKSDVSHNHDDRYYTETEINSKLSDKANTGHVHSIDDVTNLQETLDTCIDEIAMNNGLAGKALEYVASLTKEVQGKADISHNHVASDITSGTFSVDRIPTITDAKISSISASKISGIIPTENLPSYVDDVVEGKGVSVFPETGESGKIYVDTETNKTYRWSGSGYVEISASLALGTTSSTAFRGDYGKVAYDHAQAKGSAFSSGLYKITTNAQGHVIGATAVTKSDIVALGIPGQDTDTTYDNATASSDGLMSSEDKTKLDGIATGANNYIHPSSAAGVKSSGLYKIATDASGHITAATAVTKNDITALGIPAQDTNTTYISGNNAIDISEENGISLKLSSDESTLPEKGDSSGLPGGGDIYQIYHMPHRIGNNGLAKHSFYLSNRFRIWTGTGDPYIELAQNSITKDFIADKTITADKIADGVIPEETTLASLGVTATAAELNYMDGVTSNVQTQLNGKAVSSHTHQYAGSSTAGGSATSAVKLDSSAGSATQPVYFSGGKPVATTYTIGASVPSGAKFTDTTYSAMKGATSSAAGSSGLVPAPAAGKQTSFLCGDGTWQSVVQSMDNTQIDEMFA